MTLKVAFPDLFTDDTLPQVIHALPVTNHLTRHVASLSGVATGAAVPSLKRVGGGAVLSQADATAQPLKKVDGAKTYAEFDGTNDRMTTTLAARPKTFVAVARYRAQPASGSWPLVAVKNSSNGNLSVIQRASNGSLVLVQGGTFVSTLNPGTGWHVIIGVIDGANSLLRIDDNAEQASTIATNTGTAATLVLGETTSKIDVAELVTYEAVLTAQERADTVTRLRAVYSI